MIWDNWDSVKDFRADAQSDREARKNHPVSYLATWVTIVALFAVALATLAGCGSDGDYGTETPTQQPSTPTPSITVGRFVDPVTGSTLVCVGNDRVLDCPG